MDPNQEKKLNILIRVLEAQKTLSPKDVEQFLLLMVEAIKQSKKELDASARGNLNELGRGVAQVERTVAVIDSKIKSIAHQVDEKLYEQLDEVKILIMEAKECMPKDGKDADEEYIIESVLERIDVKAETGESIKEKLQELKGDKRLDRSAIKGFDLMVEKSYVDRAIEILDERTQFLINKRTSSLLSGLDDVLITNPTAGDLLFYNGTNWINTPVDNNGILSLNGLSSAVQLFATGTSGTDFNISSVVATHTFNLPTASSVNRGALSPTDWATFNNKIGSINSLTAVAQFLDNDFSGTEPNWTASGGDTHVLNIPMASGTGVTAGLLSNADYNTFATAIPYAGSGSGFVAYGNPTNTNWISNSSFVWSALLGSLFISSTNTPLNLTNSSGTGVISKTGPAGTVVDHIVAANPTGGLTASIGSLAVHASNYLYQKYNTGNNDWGIPVLFNPLTSYIQSPLSYIAGNFSITFNTAGGKFAIGDAGSVANRTLLQVQDAAQELQFLTGGSQKFSAGVSSITMAENYNFSLGTTTGTKWGITTSQKQAWYGSTPVVQQTGNISTALSTYGLVIAGTLGVGDITGGAALTRTNDTNITVTLGGTPASALLQAVSLTMGWSGTLAATRGGTGFGSYTVGDFLYADTTTTLAKIASVSAGSYMRSGGVGTAPVWSTAKLPNTATAGDFMYASASNTYSNLAIGASGTILTSSGAAPQWSTAASLGSITVNTGTSGTDFNISGSPVSLGGTVTLNIPDASLTARGLVTTGTQSFEGRKTFNNNVSINGNTVLGDASGDSLSITAGTWSILSATAVTVSSTVNFNSGLFYIDGTNSRIGVNTASPSAVFHARSTASAASGGQEVARLDATYTSGTVGSGAMLAFYGGATQFGAINSLTEASNKIGLSFSTYNSGLGERMRIEASGKVGIGTTSPDQLFHVEASTALTNTVTYLARLSHITSGTAAANFGAGLEYELENGGGTNIVAGSLDMFWSDPTNTSEDTTFSVRLARNGTVGSKLTLDSLGLLSTGTLALLSPTLGGIVTTLQSVATNDDPTEYVYQNRVATTDATVTTLHTFTVPSSTTYAVDIIVVARRTGGSAGTAEDGARYRLQAVYKNVAGTATIIGSITASPVDESQAGWDCTLDTTGATVRVRVTGATNNNITWHMSRGAVYPVSS